MQPLQRILAPTELQPAAEEGVDLIVVGTSGGSGLMHVLLGSAPCPVLTVPARRGPALLRPLLTGNQPSFHE